MGQPSALSSVEQNDGWTLQPRPARREGDLPAWLAIPAQPCADRPVIVAVHGLSRGAREQARLLGPLAAAHGQILVAPLFDRGWKRYQQLVVRDRADLALIALLEGLTAEFPQLRQRIVLAGFSGGAQFAHRFAMLHPHRVERVVATAAGWYTFPNDAPFPYGLGDAEGPGAGSGPALAQRLDAFLKLPITVAVGAFDSVPDATVRRRASLDRVQGVDRRTRGRRWANAVNTLARARGAQPRVIFHELKDCAHDFAVCVAIGALDRLIVEPSHASFSR